LIEHLTHRIVVAVAALTSDADPDIFVDEHGPSDVMTRTDLPIGHGWAAGTTARRVEVDEYASRLRVYRVFEKLGGGAQGR
jgi:hypothetical protein